MPTPAKAPTLISDFKKIFVEVSIAVWLTITSKREMIPLNNGIISLFTYFYAIRLL